MVIECFAVVVVAFVVVCFVTPFAREKDSDSDRSEGRDSESHFMRSWSDSVKSKVGGGKSSAG